MRRREFLGSIGIAAAGWPLGAYAQQLDSGQRKRIGVLIGRPEKDPEGQKQAAALEKGLAELGWSRNRNIEIDYRWETQDSAKRLAFAKEIVALNPVVVVANSTPNLVAAQQATSKIPIVFVAIADPVAQGFVTSLAHPGGMITGFGVEEPEMGGKWVELLKEMAPSIERVTVIYNPSTSPFARMFLPSIEASLTRPSVALTVAPVVNEAETEHVIAAAADRPASGLVFVPDSFIAARREFVVGAVAKYRLPAIYWLSTFAQSGGLISYGIDRTHIFYRAATYVDRIMKGEKPADLPVEMPTKFELAINLKAAKALGLTPSAPLLTSADEVIE
jgi:putative ABC transport system substrate-binding protein